METELYKMIRVAYSYGEDIPDSLIAYGLARHDFMPIIRLYKAGYKQLKAEHKPAQSKKTTAKNTTKGAKK